MMHVDVGRAQVAVDDADPHSQAAERDAQIHHQHRLAHAALAAAHRDDRHVSCGFSSSGGGGGQSSSRAVPAARSIDNLPSQRKGAPGRVDLMTVTWVPTGSSTSFPLSIGAAIRTPVAAPPGCGSGTGP